MPNGTADMFFPAIAEITKIFESLPIDSAVWPDPRLLMIVASNRHEMPPWSDRKLGLTD